MFTGAGPEYWLLPAVIKHLRPGTILELGTEFAMSTRIMRFMAPLAKITTVDVQDCSKFVKDLNVDFICKPSEDVLETWTDPVDLLFIDTEHTYEQVTKELNGFSKFVTGAILLHDILSFPDVERAIKDWLDESQWQYQPYNVHFGMGLLWRKHEEPKAG
jgi:predicted O-methyltransferase YrrM